MANRIKDKIRKLEAIRDNFQKEAIKSANKFEKEIIRLNASQFEQGKGSDGQRLVNSNPLFSGRYTLLTQIIAQTKPTVAPKTAGNIYNFAWTGDFLSGMYVDFKPDGKYTIFSNGMGTGDKLSFFKGYNNLFGLTDENKQIIIDKIKEDLRKYLRSKL